MASKGNWTIVFDDRTVIKNYAEGANEGVGYVVSDDSFWTQSKFSNIWAIQYGNSITSDEVEYRDTTRHSSFVDANIGDISQFSNLWDAAHLNNLQTAWDENDGNTYDENGNVTHIETESEKTTRLGPRPTSYSS